MDGGFGYLRMGWPSGDAPTPVTHVLPNVTRQMLYDDWNSGADRYGYL